ncbi:MAG: restriction endonuclease subunit S [Gammaproteobacteria bacterium]
MPDKSLPCSWCWSTLGKMADPNSKAIVSGPFGSNIGSRFFVEKGVPVIRGNNLTIDITRFVDEGFVFVTEEKADELGNCDAVVDDLVFTAAGSLGQVGIIPKSARYPRYIISNKQLRARVDALKVYPLFAFYWFSSKEMIEYVQQRNTGSSVPLINLSVLRSLPLPIPPLFEQRTIASLLGALDDKIELNHQMNETLEATARLFFKDWLVDFGPTRAKAERRPPYLAPELWALFPDTLDDDDKPVGWEIEPIGEHMVNFDSKRVPVSGTERAKRKGPYPYHGATSVMDYVDDYLFDGIYLLVGEDGSVVQENGKAVTQYVSGKIWVNNHAHVLQGKGAVTTEQLYMYFQFESVEPYITGAVQLKLSQGRMNLMPFIFPGDKICQVFGDVVLPLFTQLLANTDEIKTLTQTRDLLLPKLMSGEIRLRDAEKIVETVA